jgi:Uma2 family endonuclease
VYLAGDIDSRPRPLIASPSEEDMELSRLRTRAWTRGEYDRLIEIGALAEDESIELLGGQLVVREPQHSPHATAVRLVDEALRRAFGQGWDVRCGLPVALDDESEPEPDVCVVAGGPRDYRDEHPARPALIVEVALTSLEMDRGLKAALYARAGIADYWILNLREQRLEVHREPVSDPGATHRWRYARIELLDGSRTVSALSAPGARIAVSDLLP